MNSLFQSGDYSQLISDNEQKTVRVKKKKRLVFFARLLTFLSGIAVFYFVGFEPVSMASAFVLLVVFLRLVSIDAGLKNDLAYLQNRSDFFNLQTADVETVIRAGNKDREIPPKGDHHFSADLGITGNNSIYNFLNRCGLETGQKMLEMLLTSLETNPDRILDRQVQVEYLRNKPEFQAHFYALAKQVNLTEEGERKFMEFARSNFKVPRYLFPLFIGFSLLTAVVITAVILGFVSAMFIFYQFILGWVISGVLKRKTAPVLDHIEFFADSLSPLQNLFTAAEKLNLPAGFADSGVLTEKNAFKSFLSLGSMVAQRANLFVNTVLTGFFIWDLYLAYTASRAGKSSAALLAKQLRTLASLDALNSLAAFAGRYGKLPFPQFAENDFEIEQMIHPFILDENPVANSFSLKGEEQLSIITGANMAGKSTFLRAVGVNIILASAGAPVLASKMIYKPRLLFTSMRSGDDLFSGKSLFFSELKRLQTLMRRAEDGEEYFILLDEILKGTNSVDKAQGSKAFIQKLLKFKIYGIIATHDLSLCKLSEAFPAKVKNNSFEVEINGTDLDFDYRLKTGVCQNMNASVLLKRMGLTD